MVKSMVSKTERSYHVPSFGNLPWPENRYCYMQILLKCMGDAFVLVMDFAGFLKTLPNLSS